ncbi:MAG: alpha-glucuronidase family glycosyl hydrolase, partial [Bacteroidota bacterium]|nr:alpha-glucuronidase family glycosyl hydrolase [Bacteroidota bacterium]
MFYKNSNVPVEERDNDLLKRMTLDDKMAQMSMTLLNVIKLYKFRRRLEFQKNGINMKNLKILLTVIIVLIICNSGCNAQSQMMANCSFEEGNVSKLQIILRHPDDPLVVFAAEELQRYVRQLFGFQPSLFRGETDGDAWTTILLGVEIDESLSEQGYVIRRIQHEGKPALLVTGGSARATLWAVYEVISNWGVHFLVQGDVFPEKAGSFHLPDLDIKREPVFPCREFRVVNDILNTTVFWNLDQHKKLFDQLVKLRFT